MFGKFSPEKYEEAKEAGDTPKVEKMQEKANAENEKNIEKYNSMRYELLNLAQEAKQFRQDHLLNIPAESFKSEKFETYPRRMYARGEGVDMRGEQDRRFEEAMEELLPPIGTGHEFKERRSVSNWEKMLLKTKRS